MALGFPSTGWMMSEAKFNSMLSDVKKDASRLASNVKKFRGCSKAISLEMWSTSLDAQLKTLEHINDTASRTFEERRSSGMEAAWSAVERLSELSSENMFDQCETEFPTYVGHEFVSLDGLDGLGAKVGVSLGASIAASLVILATTKNNQLAMAGGIVGLIVPFFLVK